VNFVLRFISGHVGVCNCYEDIFLHGALCMCCSHCSMFQSLPLCVWSPKAVWWVTKTGLFCNCISSNCNISNPAYCHTIC
jgi:hypothetical protein